MRAGKSSDFIFAKTSWKVLSGSNSRFREVDYWFAFPISSFKVGNGRDCSLQEGMIKAQLPLPEKGHSSLLWLKNKMVEKNHEDQSECSQAKQTKIQIDSCKVVTYNCEHT